MDVQQILEAALELDPADRESLVAQLIESLIGEPFASDDEPFASIELPPG